LYLSLVLILWKWSISKKATQTAEGELGIPAYLGLGQLEVTNLNQILDVLHEVAKINAGHIQDVAGIVVIYRLPLVCLMVLVEFGEHVESVRVIGVEALDHACVVLNLLQLVTISEVAISLKSFVHAGEALHKGLPLPIPLGLRGGGRRASLDFTAQVGWASDIVCSHCGRRAQTKGVD
jgi:hypothetical protein